MALLWTICHEEGGCMEDLKWSLTPVSLTLCSEMYYISHVSSKKSSFHCLSMIPVLQYWSFMYKAHCNKMCQKDFDELLQQHHTNHEVLICDPSLLKIKIQSCIQLYTTCKLKLKIQTFRLIVKPWTRTLTLTISMLQRLLINLPDMPTKTPSPPLSWHT